MYIKQIFEEKKEGKEYEIKGWVYRIRKLKNMVFVVVRDSYGIIQTVVSDENVTSFNNAEKLKMESSLIIKGTLQKNEKAPAGYELKVNDLKIVDIGEDFPIQKDFSKEFLADKRHLWLRSRKMTSMLKVRSAITGAIHEYYKGLGFYEFQSPILQSTQCEGGSELFEVKYFKEKAYLTQTWQLPAEAAIFALENIYTVSPTFRAEKSLTARHLTEFWMIEAEMAWADFDVMLDNAEGLVKHILKVVLRDCKEELAFFERDTKDLEIARDKPFPKITYDEALKLLKEKKGMEVPWGKDLRTIEEETLMELFELPVIVTRYPKEVKAFYMPEDKNNSKVVLGADFLVPGVGELIGSSQREENINEIIKRLKAQGENPDEYEFYLDTRRYGSVPHAGYGMGLERMIRWICGLETIKDAIAFPRTPNRIKP